MAYIRCFSIKSHILIFIILKNMQTLPFLVHYPSGAISIALRDEEKPDAFLLPCPQGTSYWVSLNFCREVVSFEEATRRAAKIKIEGRRCELLNLFPLWYLFQNWFNICRMLQILGQKPLPDGLFWAKPQSNHYFCVRLDKQKTEHCQCNPRSQKAMFIAGIENFLTVQNDAYRQSLLPSLKNKHENDSKKTKGSSRRLKPMQHH